MDARQATLNQSWYSFEQIDPVDRFGYFYSLYQICLLIQCTRFGESILSKYYDLIISVFLYMVQFNQIAICFIRNIKLYNFYFMVAMIVALNSTFSSGGKVIWVNDEKRGAITYSVDLIEYLEYLHQDCQHIWPTFSKLCLPK